MRTTIKLDDELLKQTLEYDGNRGLSKSRLVEKAFRALVRRERRRRSFRLKWSQRVHVPLTEQHDLDPAVLRAMQAGDQK